MRRGLHRVAKQGLVYEEPKADRSRRTLALPGQLVEALRAHRAAQLEERVAAGSLWQDDDLVFAEANGKPIEEVGLARLVGTPCRRRGPRRPAARRPAHRSDPAAVRGRPPRVVMEVLGHAQIRTTTDTYSHVKPALGKDAAERMGKTPWD